MDIRQLRYVLEVADTKNFSAAAENLYVTQSALSQQIRSLEKEIGITIFHRTTHYVELTKIGEEFCDYARNVITAMDELLEVFPPLGASKKLSLALFPFYAKVGLQNSIVSFISQHPNIQTTLHAYDTHQVYEQLRAKNIDIAVVKSSPDNLLDEFVYETILVERLNIIISERLPQSKLKEIPFDVLEKLPLLTGEKNSYLYYRSKEFYTQNSANINVRVYNTRNVDMMVEMIKAGVGIILATESVGEALKSEGITYVPIVPKDPVETLIVHRKEHLSPAAKLFKEYIINEYKNL